ncbi:NAD(+) diphosphatase [Ornithinimicrobium sp. W1679]|uniref:NAD(+) diphosphatase n=1 Tax=unclassified Ornithinimicrobium TaxID=2615080 RepID=UPI003CF1F1F0
MSPPDETLLDLALSRSTVPRSAHERADAATLERALADSGTRVVDLLEGRARVVSGPSARLALRAPRDEDAGRTPWFLGRHGGTAYLAVDLGVAEEDGAGAHVDGAQHQEWASLREVGADLDDLEAGLLTTATALHGWHRTHRHCPRCGDTTDVVQAGWVRRCRRDGSEHYPRTDPAVIMAVVDDADRLLLATGRPWPDGRVSVLAGFVEAGETLEAAVAREVHEEVGVEVTDVQYRGNQPWPFPASLMLGFRARAATVALTVDPVELRYAAWYTREELRTRVQEGTHTLPSRVSIARVLIEEWLGGPVDAPPGRDDR